MIVISVLVFSSVLIIALGGYFLVSSGDNMSREVKRRLALLSLRGIEESDIPDILKNELLSDVPALNRILACFEATLNIDRRLKQAGMQCKVGAFLLISVSAFALGIFVGFIAHWPWPLTLAVGALLLVLPNTFVNIRRKRRLRTFVAHFPDALEMFARSLRAGHSFTGAIQLVSQEMPDPVGTEFRQVFDEQNLGVPLRDALTGMTQRIDSIEVRFFVTAILIQRETGGNLAEIIDKIAHVIRERFRIEGQLKIFTAQARMTGTILVLLPIGVAVAIGILNPDYLKPLWFEKVGKLMIALAICMQLAGAMAIRKIIRIKI